MSANWQLWKMTTYFSQTKVCKQRIPSSINDNALLSWCWYLNTNEKKRETELPLWYPHEPQGDYTHVKQQHLQQFHVSVPSSMSSTDIHDEHAHQLHIIDFVWIGFDIFDCSSIWLPWAYHISAHFTNDLLLSLTELFDVRVKSIILAKAIKGQNMATLVSLPNLWPDFYFSVKPLSSSFSSARTRDQEADNFSFLISIYCPNHLNCNSLLIEILRMS